MKLETLRKKLYPRPQSLMAFSPHGRTRDEDAYELPVRAGLEKGKHGFEPRTTSVSRRSRMSVGRSGFHAGRRREGPKRTDGRARMGVHVVLPKGRGAPTGGWQGKWAPVSRFANRPTKNANIPDDKPQPETPP